MHFPRLRLFRVLPAVFLACLAAMTVLWAAEWDPPGPPLSDESRMKSLNEVEPRTIIASLPYTITNSGAFYLIDNLTGSSGEDGITISADNVRLDLNGFALVGKVDSLSGIDVPAVRYNLVIQNGMVNGWGEHGVSGFNTRDSRFADLICSGNGKDGISAGQNSVVVNCGMHKNGWRGIIAQEGSTVTGCKASGNSLHGIMCYSATRVSECTAKDNLSDGIWVKDNCDVRNCTSTWNTNNGIQATHSCTIMDNHCGENGAAGIRVAGSGSRIENNHLVKNQNAVDATSPQGGNLIIRNTSAESTGNAFVVSTNNYYGSIISVDSISRYGFTTNTPWANFEY